jgi:hypothetical protein
MRLRDMEKKFQRVMSLVAFIIGMIGGVADDNEYWQAVIAGCAWAIVLYIVTGGFCSEE